MTRSQAPPTAARPTVEEDHAFPGARYRVHAVPCPCGRHRFEALVTFHPPDQWEVAVRRRPPCARRGSHWHRTLDALALGVVEEYVTIGAALADADPTPNTGGIHDGPTGPTHPQ